ncbi:MAG: PIG-L deacetylase family protein [Burkholderiaceae bacterium]
MLPFPLLPRLAPSCEILCIGAHCDDIEIGCGGTLLTLQRAYPGTRIHWLVLTSNPKRRTEALRSMRRFVRPAARGEVLIHDLPDGRLPGRVDAAKSLLEACRERILPDLVFTHHADDRHQDHAIVAHLTWQTFRDHAIWAYEIPKWDGDLATPNAYVPLPATLAERKARFIVATFDSQQSKSWFRNDNLLALMRLRGLECHAESGFAEAFHCRKLVFRPLTRPVREGRP